MEIDRLETHDRLLHFQKQSIDISDCCQDMINQKPFGDHPFYIFAHKRELGLDERFKLFSSGKFLRIEDVPTHTIIWQPRLTKPKAQTNSMLFKGYPGTDKVKVIWMIPARELWDTFEKGKMTESSIVSESIHDFQYDRGKLECKEDDDLSDETIDRIYREISADAKYKPILTQGDGASV